MFLFLVRATIQKESNKKKLTLLLLQYEFKIKCLLKFRLHNELYCIINLNI
jgi:hypothetical protein